MADAAAARREARRRKILQNSEARLQKLAGIEHEKQGTHNEEAKENKSTTKDSPTTLPQASVQNTRNEDIAKFKSSTREETYTEDGFVNRVTEELTGDEATTPKRDSIRNATENTEPKSQESQESNIPEFLNGVNVGLSSGAEGRIQEEDVSLTEEGSWPSRMKHMFLLVFAVLVRCLLACEEMQVFVMKSAVIPFLMLQCGVVGFDILIRKGSQTTQPTMSLLSTALVLTGVSKTTIAMLTKTTTYLTAILSDFAWYMFVFIVTHSVLQTIA
ncbi:CAMLG [Branchiostoma lanceolatum]|uniref:CAMLG protein n=1 Tax=Branchiostoma lanceolatum TaxID=7740 RepID=A0A8J9Z3H7_BRALA|nr:CAMLG [Branchiostoma lanceolatum]